MMTQPAQPGCGSGCLRVVVGFAVLVFALSVFGNSCGPDTSPSVPTSPSRPAPVEEPGYLPALCEGRDYVEYDDCKIFGDE